ncbi:MAG: hypothetical protein NTW87_19515, partial [Planctomycetota bacterium]|nr:hypothetical protein [Planctomycetota bacterium]
GDARSEPLRIRVLARPEVDVTASSDCIAYTLPAYTGQREPLVDRFGGLSALIGSTARVRFRPTKPLASARLERSDGRSFLLEKKVEAGPPVTGKDGVVAEGPAVEWWELPSLPLEKNASFHMSLTDVDGLRNSEPPVEYPIEARPDLPPTIKLVKPTRDLTVTPQARVNVSFVARDDWAVRTVWLVYRVQTEGQGEGGAVKRLERAVPHERNPPPISFTWDIAALNAKVGDQIVFWLEADDDCTTNNFLPAIRGRKGADVAPAPVETAEKQEVFPRSSDIKLSVVSREEKLMELQAEVERLYQQLMHAKENQEELKAKVLLLLEEIAKLKAGN